MNPFARRHWLLGTALDPDDCQARLRARLVSWNNLARWSLFEPAPTDRPVAGSISARGFSLHKFIRYRNGCQTQVVGRFVPRPEGSEIPLSFGLNRWTVIGDSISFAVMLLVLTGSLGRWLLANPSSPADPAIALVTIGMLAFVAATTSVGLWLARGDERFLLDFLCTTLDAQELPTGER